MFNYSKKEKIFPACPVCDGEQFVQLAGNDRYGMKIKTAGCLRCGLVQTWPRLSASEMNLFYQDHYREYYQAVTTPDVEYVKSYRKDERLEYTAKLITANVQFTQNMRVLDVGCAEGTLFANLKKCFNGELTLVGVEPSENYAAYARKMISCTTYPNIDELVIANEKKFDIIIVNHVLEHVDNPVIFLGKLKNLLLPDGFLFIDVPDISGYSSPRDLHIAHLFHFSQQTLLEAVEKTGYKVLSITQHCPPYHPTSLWCLAKIRDIQVSGSNGIKADRAGWKRIQWLNLLIPFYLIKVRLRGNPMVAFIWNKLKGI